MAQIQVTDTLEEWRKSAAYWAKHSHTIRRMFAPVTDALIEEARIAEGQTILDVACGAGEPAFTIATKVGPTGSVACTDAVAEMLAAARNEAHKLDITNVSFRESQADSLPFPERSFDAAVSRLGVMFFPDPLVALREMLRVVKPSGRIALAVWGKSELNPFSYTVTKVVDRYIKTPPSDPDAPNAFRFAEPGKLATILAKAGAIDVTERNLEYRIEAPITPKEFWEMRSETSGTLREKLALIPEGQVKRLEMEVLQEVTEFFPDNQMSFPALMLIVSGKKMK